MAHWLRPSEYSCFNTQLRTISGTVHSSIEASVFRCSHRVGRSYSIHTYILYTSHDWTMQSPRQVYGSSILFALIYSTVSYSTYKGTLFTSASHQCLMTMDLHFPLLQCESSCPHTFHTNLTHLVLGRNLTLVTVHTCYVCTCVLGRPAILKIPCLAAGNTYIHTYIGTCHAERHTQTPGSCHAEKHTQTPGSCHAERHTQTPGSCHKSMNTE